MPCRFSLLWTEPCLELTARTAGQSAREDIFDCSSFAARPCPARSRPAMVAFNGALYRHVHNLQGDVLGLVDNAGNLMIEYRHRYMGVAGVGVHEA